jgi:hypothetical protein
MAPLFLGRGVFILRGIQKFNTYFIKSLGKPDNMEYNKSNQRWLPKFFIVSGVLKP